MRENPENQSFTFFAFLPPYLRVSDSLAYFKRRGLKRSIVSYKKFLISWHVARYSAVFVFESMDIHGNPWKHMEIHGILWTVEYRHMEVDTWIVEYEPMDVRNYGLHLEVVWTTSGSNLDYISGSSGLHLDVNWTTSGSHLDFIWKSLGLHLEVIWM